MAWSKDGVENLVTGSRTMKRTEQIESSGDRYTLDGGVIVERRIDTDQQLIARKVMRAVPAEHFAALILMGGYGRGEGGYIMCNGSPAPYNDYDYFLVIKGMTHTKARRFQNDLQSLAHELSDEVGIEVDLAVLRQEQLNNLPFTLMNAEMKWGHRVIAGDAKILKTMPAMPIENLAKGEFVRLMNNRGALLLHNAKQLAGKGENLDPEGRAVFFKYLYKAILACGDVLLAANDRYHVSYVKKLERIKSLKQLPVENFIELYQKAVDQKFHPDHAADHAQNLVHNQKMVVSCWLDTLSYFESRRLGNDLSDWHAYSSSSIPKGQLESSSVVRNLLITIRDYGLIHSLRHINWSLRYPRERLIAVLPGLLTSANSDIELPRNYTIPLGFVHQPDWSESVECYLGAWARYA